MYILDAWSLYLPGIADQGKCQAEQGCLYANVIFMHFKLEEAVLSRV